MGKRLQTRFSDVNTKIIKRPKKDTSKLKPKREKLKRKSSIEIDEPIRKTCRIGPLIKTQLKSNSNVKNEFEIEEIFLDKINKTDVILKPHEDIQIDLLYTDELKNSIVNFINRDILFHILDEIALEGLDGITLEAFWKRLCIALENLPFLNYHLKNFIWQNICVTNGHLRIYQLQEPRKELEIHNRFDYLNTDIGVVMELAYELPDIYPPHPVSESGVMGSCSTFNEREDITDSVINLPIVEVEKKYGQKLVLVANQNLRQFTLYGDLTDPLIEMNEMEYSFLERVGRSRKLGELTQGRMSISSAFKMDPKSVFHYKKKLCANDLVSKQFFYIKSPLLDSNKSGSLLHLRRFYTNFKSFQTYMAAEIINLLKQQPDFRMDSKKLRENLSGTYSCMGKLLKNSEFRKCVRIKIYPYKIFYPKSLPYEYINKNKFEKQVTCYELINPYVNVAAYWKMGEQDESDEEEEKEEESDGQIFYNMDILRNIYYHIYLSGEKGCTSNDIMKATGLDVHYIRSGIRKLSGKGLIIMTKFDVGKIRKFRYTVSCLKKPEVCLRNNFHDEKPAISSVKTKLIEKQKAALAKKKTIQDQSSDSEVLNNFLQIEKPLISSWNFIVNINKLTNSNKLCFSLIKREDILLRTKYKLGLKLQDLENINFFNINEVIGKVSSNIESLSHNFNCGPTFTKKFGKCLKSLTLLLKASLGEIKINEELFQNQSNITTESALPVLPDLTDQRLPTLSNSDRAKLDYMGDKPVVEYLEKDKNVTVEIISSTVPEKFRFDKQYQSSSHGITNRVLDRIQFVLDLVHEMKVIEEFVKLTHLITEHEAKSGSDNKIDRKSLFRILKRLVLEGYIKIYKLVVCDDTLNKTVVFICHPSIKYTDDTIKTSCQQIKWKYFTGCSKKNTKPNVPGVQKTLEAKIGKSPFSQSDVLNSISEMNKLSKTIVKEINKKHNKRIGVVYGVKPKFTRMRILHEFLFYLIYNFTGFQNPIARENVQALFKNYRIELSEKDLNEMPNIYVNEINWKMFIPPLPNHTGWGSGWALVCDIILRFPISVLLKIHNCPYEDSELLELLNHPVKRYMLVKDLPEMIRRSVLFKRKYLFDTYDTINRLLFCGLVQFGPQKYREKDQVFIYLNRRASLKDTRSSSPGYNVVEDKDYPTIPFYFNNQVDVEQYWNTLNTISLNTKLNTRQPGKIVTLTYINSRPEITDSLKSRNSKEAILHDNGTIPGDGKGAGGLDSSLWCHLVRNWFWTKGSYSNSIYSDLSSEKLKAVPSKEVQFNDLCSNSIPKFYFPILQRSQIPIRLPVGHKVKKVTKNKKIMRVIQKPKKKLKKRAFHDELDKKILNLGVKRSKWTPQEQEYAFLCKVGDVLLNGRKKYIKQIMPYTVVRDVLHRMCPLSKYKTSRAVQRHYIKYQKNLLIGIENKVYNLFKLKPIANTFGVLINKIGIPDKKTKTPFKLTESQLSAAYIILMSYLFRNKNRIFDALEGNLVNNDYLSNNNLKFTEETAFEIDAKEKKFSDPQNEFDVKKELVKSIIHSSLCVKKEKDFSNHLFKIYQNYPDTLIKAAVKDLQDANIICHQTAKERKLKTVVGASFILSQFYVYFQCSTFNNVTAEEAFRSIMKLVKNKNENIEVNILELDNKRYGQLLGLNEFMSFYEQFKFKFYFPENTIILNPDIDNYEELVNELAIRYQLKLKSLQDTNETETTELDLKIEKTKSQEHELIDEDKEVSNIFEQVSKTANNQDSLDLTAEGNNLETITRLKTWVTDCITAEYERRSPSPEFMAENIEEINRKDSQNNVSEKNIEESTTDPRGNFERPVGQIPSLNDIKEEMLNGNINDEERTIPHITELSDLLNKNFGELKTDMNTLVRLKSYFITEYTNIEKIIIDNYEELQEHYLIKYLNDSERNKKIWERIENDFIIKKFLNVPNFEELIREEGGTEEDVNLAYEIISFAEKKEIFGVTTQELKTRFQWPEKNYFLINIIKILVKTKMLLQTGVVNLVFVHYNYQLNWVVQKEYHKEIVDWTGFRIMPWINVYGFVDKSVLISWISLILSYTLDFPNVTFGKLCDKYCYLKPVDLFYIIQILEELGCIELFIYEKQEEDIFKEWTMPQKRYATILDDLEDIMIQPNNVSMICLGSFLYEQLST